MQNNVLFKNAFIVNEGKTIIADLWVKDGMIQKIAPQITLKEKVTEVDARGKWLLPGVIDDQVHFREPGLTYKATIGSEARAAVAGGVTSFMEMPNTNPPATTQELLEQKYDIGANTSVANYSFFMGVANNNVAEVLKANEKLHNVCGIKIFMGSSTGDMLVDNFVTLNTIFSETGHLIATHCEDERIIAENKKLYPDPTDASFHPLIRNAEACFESSFTAIQLAKKYDTRLHILHITTAKELQLFSNMLPLQDKRITNEVCVHHLHFTADDYASKGNLIKCNPAIKAPENKAALWEALLDDRLDIIATDHAPHTWEEKQQPYAQAPAGLPLVQHSLQLMLQYVAEGKITIEKVVEKMCHAPAVCFQIAKRGYIREGYAADLVLVAQKSYEVNKSNILYHCAWSPIEGTTFKYSIEKTYVNGNLVFENGQVFDAIKGQRLTFER
ncbi:dihydroorotase [Taibaiella sp. KBW10]|uniref:dihydroorotase n=1 Tax=Taibaiella sp. KBW10 TaxID=2153357 RepID=UPI000F597CEB|nr:dihydroorotase [Taibaiella sp. KBW10]RQO30177.1 dihydroorotase [Taibaiella sp. KBW10]